MTDQNENRSWWTTLPGIITAMTSLITAVGGLLVVLNANGYMAPKQTARAGIQAGENFYPSSKEEENKTPLNLEKESAPRNDSRTFQLTGNVGRLQVVFNLTFNATTKKIRGSYYYSARQNAVYEITGIILSNGIELTEFTSNVKTATCSLNSANNCYSGRMYNTNGKQFDMNICKVEE